MSQLLTQYSAWLSKDVEDVEEYEKLIRLCRSAAGVCVTCLKAAGQSQDEIDRKTAPLLAPAKTATANVTSELYVAIKRQAAETVTAILNKPVRSGIESIRKSVASNERLERTAVGSILNACAIEPGT